MSQAVVADKGSDVLPPDTSRRKSARFVIATALAFAALAAGVPAPADGQTSGSRPQPRQLTIPYLANDTKPADLDFAAALCDIAPDGATLECRFRQVFLTVPGIDPASCVMTTNGYTRTFRRQSPTRWISSDAPAGDCGLVETTTLDDGGETRWTLTIRKVATKQTDEPRCRIASEQTEVYSWRHVKRQLPCTTFQPGAIER